MKKIWDYATWGVAVYSIYKHMLALNEAKNDLYLTLEPAQQARWDSMFGKPVTVATIPLAPTLTQVVSGT